jgi:hypothetical protein
MFWQIASSLGKMIEIDWNSLFSSFFSMVRVKVACKDATKVPRKRLFEMNNSLYLIQFKVESDEGSWFLRGEDGDDLGNEDDEGMEELDHDSVPEKERSPDPKRGGNASSDRGPGQGSSSKQGSVNRKKVSSWATLFQSDEVTNMLGVEMSDQYSCMKLLRDMEALDSDDDNAEIFITQDEELVMLLEKLCSQIANSDWRRALLDDLYEIPDMMDSAQDGKPSKEGSDQGLRKVQHNKKQEKKKWSPVLVEKRPSRVQKDGRTILEKAQDRKKQINLEETKGINRNHNPFSLLSSSEISDIADVVGVNLGVESMAKDKIVSDILSIRTDREVVFKQSCDSCNVEKGNSDPSQGANMGDDPCTPVNQVIKPQMEDDLDNRGQWTYVENREKNKSKVSP